MLATAITNVRAIARTFYSRYVFAGVLIAASPIFLLLFGIDLSLQLEQLDSQISTVLIHTSLEFLAICIAALTVILAAYHYGMSRALAAPVVGLAIFYAAIFDVIKILVANQILFSHLKSADFISFTWAAGRFLYASVLFCGACFFLLQKKKPRVLPVRYLILLSAVVFLSSYWLLYDAARSFSDQFYLETLKNILNGASLFLLFLGVVFVFPQFYLKTRSYLAYGILVSIWLDISSVLCMAVQPENSFASNFFVAHFLKMLSYLIPFMALMLDYKQNYRQHLQTQTTLKATFSAVPDLLFLIDNQGFFLDHKPSKNFSLGLGSEQLVGKNIQEILPNIARMTLIAIKRAIKKDKVQEFEYTMTVAGEERFYEARTVATGSEAALVMIRDITITRQVHEALIAGNKELASASKLKSQFLANISHELRTPLNSIIGFSSLAINNANVVKKHLGYFEKIHQNGRHLLAIINDLLDLSKIEAGKSELNLRTISLETIIEDSMMVVANLATDRSVKLSQQSDMIEAICDEAKLKQILVNLLSNAIKFADRNDGQVKIKVYADRNYYVIKVIDNGIGIPKHMRETIFDPFRQVDQSMSRQYEGTGLGLAICRRLAQLMQGSIFVRSKESLGSVFVLRLPLKPLSESA